MCYLCGSLVMPLPKASSGHEPEERLVARLSCAPSRGVRGSLGVRMRVILASASIMAKSAGTSLMPGIRSGIDLGCFSLPLGSWAGMGVEGTGVNGEAQPMDSFLTNRSTYSTKV